MDATKPIAPGLKLAVSGDSSGAEQVASWAAGAKVVKAFNTTGAENMINPIYHGEATTLFICGDEAQAKAEMMKDRRMLAIETMPIELKHALLDLRNADPGDRRELAQQIADDALAGVYGPQAQHTVETIRASDFWQECIAD